MGSPGWNLIEGDGRPTHGSGQCYDGGGDWAIRAGPGGLIKGRADQHPAGVTWQTTGHVCETLPPRERVLEEQRHPGCDAVGLGLTEKCHAWALQRFGLVLTWFQPVSQAPSGLSIPLELSEVLPEGIDTAQVI